MARKAGMSEVKLKVRYNALFLREFTVADMVRATGLKPESVRTELQRMRREGLLTSEPLTEKRRGRGGRPALYKLTQDPEKRLALSHEVESFFPEPLQPIPPRPTSRHYLVASRILDRVATGYYKTDKERDTALQEAEERLKFAEYEEGESQELIRAYIDRERARLEYLRGHDETAESLFRQVQEAFTTAELDHEVERINEYLTCIQARRRWLQEGALNPPEQARCILEVLGTIEQPSDRPLMNLLVRLLHELSRSMREQVLTAAWEQVAQVRVEVARTIREEFRREPRPAPLLRELEEVERRERAGREPEDWTASLARKVPRRWVHD